MNNTQRIQRRAAFPPFLLCVLCVFPSSGASASPPGQDRQDKAAIQKCAEISRRSFVGIEIHLRKKSRIEKSEEPDENLDTEEQQTQTLAENRQTLDTFGVVIDKDGTLLMPDLRLRSEHVEKIVATMSDGTSFEARLDAVGRRYDFVTLKPVDLKRPLEPIAFEEFRGLELGTDYYVTYVDRADQQWHVNVSPWIVTNAPLKDEKSWMLIDQPRRGGILFDSKARPVGIPLDLYLWKRGERDSFIGRNILADERIPLADLEKKAAEIQRSLVAGVRKVEAVLREDKKTDYYDAEAKSLTLNLFGLPVDEKGSFLVPYDLGAELVRRIEEVRTADGAASFQGSFKTFGAMLLRAAGAAPRPSFRTDVTEIEPGALCWTASIEDRFGGVFARIEMNRVFRTEKGQKGAFKQDFRWRARLGSFVLDADGRPIGIYTAERRDEDIEEAVAEASRERYYGAERYRQMRSPFLRRIYLFSEIKDALADPGPHFDPRAVPMSTKKEKTLVWIGVEYQELAKPLAESLGIADKELTNEGKRGLLVTLVYPDSPAAKAGIQPDDVLLSVRPDGEAKATDLTPESDQWSPRGYGAGRGGIVPWLPRRNYLTMMLTGIGAGKKVAFDFLRGRDKKSLALALEEGPTDYETADKFKDDALGITAKELTYEVRHFQKMTRDDTGVVVAKVESGSRAEVGKLQALSIITRLNDAPVKNLAHFRELLEKHRAARARSVTLTVLAYGQTRLVDIELSAKER